MGTDYRVKLLVRLLKMGRNPERHVREESISVVEELESANKDSFRNAHVVLVRRMREEIYEFYRASGIVNKGPTSEQLRKDLKRYARRR